MRLSLTATAGLGLLSAVPAFAQDGPEAQIRVAEQRWAEAWAAHDARAVATGFDADATFQNPFGVRLHGRAEIEAFLTRLFRQLGYLKAYETSMARIDSVRMVSADAAAVWTETRTEGQVDDQSGQPIGPRDIWVLDVVSRGADGWRIVDELIMDVAPLP